MNDDKLRVREWKVVGCKSSHCCANGKLLVPEGIHLKVVEDPEGTLVVAGIRGNYKDIKQFHNTDQPLSWPSH
jgi:hypothetical protein